MHWPPFDVISFDLCLSLPFRKGRFSLLSFRPTRWSERALLPLRATYPSPILTPSSLSTRVIHATRCVEVRPSTPSTTVLVHKPRPHKLVVAHVEQDAHESKRACNHRSTRMALARTCVGAVARSTAPQCAPTRRTGAMVRDAEERRGMGTERQTQSCVESKLSELYRRF